MLLRQIYLFERVEKRFAVFLIAIVVRLDVVIEFPSLDVAT